MKMYFKLMITVVFTLFSMSCNQKNIEENKVNHIKVDSSKNNNSSDSVSIRAFEEIFFGNINPKLKNDSERYNFLQQFGTELAGTFFHSHSATELIDSHYGLYQFGMVTLNSFDFAEAKKINLELKSIVEKKYSIGKKINISDKNMNEKHHTVVTKIMNENNLTIKDELGIAYDKYEYVWTKNDIQVMLGYWVEYNWVDKNNEILRYDVTDLKSRIKGQKIFYRPKLKFTHLELKKRVRADEVKRMQSYEKEKTLLENKRRQKDSEKF